MRITDIETPAILIDLDIMEANLQRVAQYAERHDLSVTEWRVIAVLGRYPGISANEVAERTAMDKVAVSRAVNRLLGAGRIKRDTHGDDRRRFPAGLGRVGQGPFPAAPFYWGLNGVLSVVGSVGTMALAVNVGFRAAMLVGCCFYVLAALASSALGRGPSESVA